MHAGRAVSGPYTNAAGTSTTGASVARTVKALGYFFQTDMRDDSAIYDAISTKLHADAEHIAREPAPPGIRMAAVQCIIGSAWRHHATGMWAPTLDQARRTQVHLCRLVVRVVLAVLTTDHRSNRTRRRQWNCPRATRPTDLGGWFRHATFRRACFPAPRRPASWPTWPGFLPAGSERMVGSRYSYSYLSTRRPRGVGPRSARRMANPGVEVGEARSTPHTCPIQLRFGTRRSTLARTVPSEPSRLSHVAFSCTADLRRLLRGPTSGATHLYPK